MLDFQYVDSGPRMLAVKNASEIWGSLYMETDPVCVRDRRNVAGSMLVTQSKCLSFGS